MITIERLNDAHIEQVNQIQLADEQVKFAGTATDFLSDGSETTHLHIIKYGSEVVGFFKLDVAYPAATNFALKVVLA
ncbi:hypothetical protein VCHA41O245_60078 [Vibrio chagasii]|nr:hypothetical protein VCHA41O245_60078 [Vibrio chagasii]